MRMGRGGTHVVRFLDHLEFLHQVGGRGERGGGVLHADGGEQRADVAAAALLLLRRVFFLGCHILGRDGRARGGEEWGLGSDEQRDIP